MHHTIQRKAAPLIGLMAAWASAMPAAHATEFTGNIGAVTEYRYRGISQSRLQPAVQGGADVALPQGFYVGTWASSIQWVKDAGGGASVELDLYGGWKSEITKGATLDVGVLRYQYPSHDLALSPNTTELYAAVTMSVVTAKYSHSVSNLFGFNDSNGSGYLDLSAAFDLGDGWSLTPHLGYQRVARNSDFSYTDWSLAVSKDVHGVALSATLVGADTQSIAGIKAYASPANGKDMGRTGVVLGAKYNF